MDLNEQIGKVVIQGRQKFGIFCSLVSLILSWKCVKSFTVTKIVPKIIFEGAWGKLEAESCFQRQSRTKYMIETIILM